MLRDTCKAMEIELQQQKCLPGQKEESDMLFADLMLKWLAYAKKDLKPTTYGNYEMQVERKIVPYFRKTGITVCNLTEDDLIKFFDEEFEGRKATTVHKYYNNISCALKYAVNKLKIIEYSPMTKVERPKSERFKAKFLRQSEAIALFDALQGHKLELGAILAVYYGLRRGEVVGLKWDAIDFEKNTISIEHTVTVAKVKGKKKLNESDSAKTDSSMRTLPLVPAFRKKLLSLKQEQKQNQKLFGKSYDKTKTEYIYVDMMGKRIRPDYLTQEFPEWLIKNGFRRLRFHDLRHSCASLLLANDVPLKLIQEWLGHSNFKITADAYAHLEYQSKIAAANAMTWLNDTSMGSSMGSNDDFACVI